MYTFCYDLFSNFFTTWIAVLAIEMLILSDIAEFILARSAHSSWWMMSCLKSWAD